MLGMRFPILFTLFGPLALSFLVDSSCQLASLPFMAVADVLPRVLALVPSDLQPLSSVRLLSRDAKACVEARWWQENVKCIKSFAERHADLFGDEPVEEDEGTVEERQEAFARNILLWVKPLLVKSPWKVEGADEDAADAATPQDAYVNLRRALATLGDTKLFK